VLAFFFFGAPAARFDGGARFALAAGLTAAAGFAALPLDAFAAFAAADLVALRRCLGLFSRRAPSNGIACSSENVSMSASRGNDAMTPSWLT
jgi:hypothetical protein